MNERLDERRNERERGNKRFGVKKQERERERKEVEEVREYIGIANKEMGSAVERTCPPCCNKKRGKERLYQRGSRHGRVCPFVFDLP